MAIGSEAGELLAEYRWVNNADAEAHSHEPEPRARIAAEAADIAIALLLFFDRIGLDPIQAIKTKLARNRLNYPVNLSRGRCDRPVQEAADGPADAVSDIVGTEGVICGIDGCRAGWVAAIKELATEHTDVNVFATLADLIQQVSPTVAAIDIPIGLPERNSRRCDLEARTFLGARGSCVFPAPLRPLLAARSHTEACDLRRKIDGRGISIQAWSIVPKVREVDDLLRDNPQLRECVREVHPEVSLYFMANHRAMAHAKKSPDGHAERVKLLSKHFGDAVARSLQREPAGCWRDDVVDAFAALWTAGRIVRGDAVTLPKDPDLDRLGLRMEIVA
jgi:predicted RNase H-like nuclease